MICTININKYVYFTLFLDYAASPVPGKLKKIHSGEIMHNSSYEDSEFEFQTQVKRQSSLERESSLVDYDDSPHFPRDKSKYTLSPMGQQNVSKVPVVAPEPNVDFEFHVKIFIKGGKCVLHTSKGSEEEKRKMKKDKSFTGIENRHVLVFTTFSNFANLTKVIFVK